MDALSWAKLEWMLSKTNKLWPMREHLGKHLYWPGSYASAWVDVQIIKIRCVMVKVHSMNKSLYNPSPACQSNQESHPALTHQQSTPPPLGTLTESLEAEWGSCLLRGCCVLRGSCGLSFCPWRETSAPLFVFSSSGWKYWKYLFQIANTCNC